jgi:hypothetical protein
VNDEDEGEGNFSVFDDDEFSDAPAPRVQPQRRPAPQQARYAEPDAEVEPPAPPKRKATEVERRLTMAAYYTSLDSFVDQLFPDDDGDEAAKVRSDLHRWVVDQMEELVGMRRAPEAPEPGAFTPQEVGVLKQLARRALAGPVPPKAPQAAPQAPMPSPKPAPRAAPQAAPKPRPQAARPARPPEEAKEEAPPVKHGKRTVKMGEVFTEKGRQFKYVPNPDDPNGNPVKVDCTRQKATNLTVPPIESKGMMEMATASYADRVRHAAIGKNETLQRQIAAAINTPA